MAYFYSKHFHLLSKGRRSLPKEWPLAWSTTYYKEYPRFQTIELSDEAPQADLFSVIQSRASSRVYQKLPITIRDVSALLKYGCGNTHLMEGDDGRHHRAAPSAGARFPIEAYLLVLCQSEGLGAGVYHYRIREHKLEVLQLRSFDINEVRELLTYEWAWEASAVIFLTAVFGRTEEKYGIRGYRYVLLEAGHITQNICLISTALGINVCPLAGTRDEKVESLLGIDGISESLVYSVALGR